MANRIVRLTENDLNRLVRRVIKEQFYEPTNPKKKLNKRIYFNNGGSVSIQASETHYSSPRNNEGPYNKVEVGYPTRGTEIPESIYRYSDGDIEDPYQTVYGYVPVDIVEEMIEMNGGVKSGNVPPFTSEEEFEDDDM